MSDFLPDTPHAARLYCPGCEPDADFMKEILDTFWCDDHRPDNSGVADHVVSSNAYLSGSTESGGDDNRKWCEFFHGGRIDGGQRDRDGDVPGLH